MSFIVCIGRFKHYLWYPTAWAGNLVIEQKGKIIVTHISGHKMMWYVNIWQKYCLECNCSQNHTVSLIWPCCNDFGLWFNLFPYIYNMLVLSVLGSKRFYKFFHNMSIYWNLSFLSDIRFQSRHVQVKKYSLSCNIVDRHYKLIQLFMAAFSKFLESTKLLN